MTKNKSAGAGKSSGNVNRLLVILTHACRILVGLVFLAAGILKSFDPTGFAYQIEAYGLISQPLSSIASIFFIVLEIILSLALIINYRPQIVVPATGALILIFMAANIWAWSQGKTEGCGCFGQFADRTPKEVLIEDTFLLVALGIAWLGSRSKKYADLRWKNWSFLGTCLFAVALTTLGPHLPVDSFVTDLKVGANLGDLSVSDIDSDLSDGEYFIVLLGDNCSKCEKIIGSINQLAEKDGIPEVVGILVGDRDLSVEFFWKYAPAFGLGYAPREELGRLYRTLPRMFLMEDGIVRKVWDDAPPTSNELESVIP